jgi:DNA mismatch repair protein MutL
LTDAVYDLLSRQLASALSLPPAAQRRWPQRPDTSSGQRAVGAAPASQAPHAGREQAGLQPSVPEHAAPEYPAREQGVSEQAVPEQAVRAGVAAAWRANAGWETPDRLPRQQSLLRIGESTTSVDTLRLDVTAPVARPTGSDPRAREAEVRWSKLRFVAQVRATYLICEADEGLYVLDQHAAAERVHFHRLKQEYEDSKMASQALLFPVTLSVDSVQRELIIEHEPDITRFGFDVQVHAEDTVSIQRVPRLLQRESTERLFRDLLAELSRSGRGYSRAVDAALSTLACHTAVRAGDSLDERQANALLRDLEGVDFAAHCPHGRPIVSFTSWSELERKVGRR